MKQNKLLAITTLLLFIFLAIFSSCKRNGIQDPNPFGPSTYSILLQLAAAPNVIFAGNSRESTTITATLKRFNGSPLANTVIHFDIRDALGNKANVGFFEGNESVKTKTTDQNGNVSLSYFGPFSQELTADTTIYIEAVVAWSGKESINEITPIYLIREAVDLEFTLIADPNILLATESRPESQLKAYFKNVDGIPLSGRKIFFDILSGPGSFTNDKRRTFVLTDSNGYAVVSYFGPTKSEIESDQVVTIQGQPETESPFSIQEEVDIQLIREDSSSPPLLTVSASPNVILAGNPRESATVTATLTRDNGVPIPNTVIHFDIRDAAGNKANLGFFSGNESVITETTDQSGMVSVVYFGPLIQELTTETTIYIKATVAWEGDEFINEQTPINLIPSVVDLTFTLIADPNVLLVTDSRPTSQLKAYFKTVDGKPLIGRKIFFEILSGPGSFVGNERKTAALTDASGYAAVTYYGPLKNEIDSDQVVTIQGQPETLSPFSLQEDVDIQLIREESSLPLLQLTASPNVIIAGSSRGSTEINATLKWSNDVPVTNTDILFDIRDVAGNQINLGFFEGNVSATTRTTVQNGMVGAIYFGPLSSELAANTTIYITATVAWDGSDLITQQTPVYLIRGTFNQAVTLIADPNVLLVTDSHPQSKLKAYFKTVYGISLQGEEKSYLILLPSHGHPLTI
ncbi:hypothetical protein ACFLQZ_01000 [Acidobacteriota bacterium]